MTTFNAKANVGAPPAGGIKIYLDEALTQEVTAITEVDFGSFPYAKIEPGQQVPATKSVKVWIKSDANVPIRFVSSVSDERVVASLPNYSMILNPGSVLAWEIKAAFKGPFDGVPVSFQVNIGSEYV